MSTTKKFKIIYGYNEDDYVSIDENELAKAYALFLEGNGRAIFAGGEAVRGQDIMRITIDWHGDQGWNKGYEMSPIDYEDVKPLEKGYAKVMHEARMIAEIAVRENKRELLTKPLAEAVTLLPPRNEQVSEATKLLVDKFKFN